MITFCIEHVTPSMAEKYLSRNKSNRSLRPFRVAAYSRDMEAGHWELTHQCIAFNSAGDLIDGQHRLEAVRQSQATVSMYVARYEDRNDTAMMLPFDSGAQRTHGDILRVSTRDTQTAMAILRIKSSAYAKGATSNDVFQCIEKHKVALALVNETITQGVRVRSSAGAKAAMVLLLGKHTSRRVELLEQFRLFVNLDLDGMWRSTAALVKSLDGISINHHGNSMQVAIRVWWALTPERNACRVVRIADENLMLIEMREIA